MASEDSAANKAFVSIYTRDVDSPRTPGPHGLRPRRMKSLRSRLIIGVSIAAFLPTAVALLILSNEVESTVRKEANQRVEAALQSIHAELSSRGALLAEQLEILGRDPELSRRLLLGSSDDPFMERFLEERRALLDLDYLALVERRAAPARTGPFLGPTLSGADSSEGLAIVAEEPIRYRNAESGVLIGTVALGDSLLESLARVAGIGLHLLAADSSTVLASSGPDPGASWASAGGTRPSGDRLFSRRAPLSIGPPPHPMLEAFASTESADRTVLALRGTAAAFGALGIVIAILLGTIWSAQIARPVERLAAFSDRVARGEWDEPLALKSVQELDSLVAALERMREDLRTYRDRLRVSERQAAWGQMARKVAHEIKNPLTPIAISIEDLKRSYQQGRPDFPEILAQATRTIAEEVESMKRMLQELSEFGRFPAPRLEKCRWRHIGEGLAALYARDIAEKRLCVERAAPDIEVRADPDQIQRALVNHVQNGFDAAGPSGHVKVSAAAEGASLRITVADDGPGLTPEQQRHLFIPGFTTKEHGSGLGLTIVERIVSEHGGSIDVRSEFGAGASISILLPVSTDSAAGARHET